MLLYRILCGFLMAWALSWALGQQQAAILLQEVPQMAVLGPVAAAFVGFSSLAMRQGWGAVVAFANGVWAGALTIAVAGGLYTLIGLVEAVRDGMITSFDKLMRVFSDTVEPLIDQLANLPLVISTLGAAAIAGVATEFLHWLLVRFRRKRQRASSS